MGFFCVNTRLLRHILVSFIREEVKKFGLSRVLVGISGGIDSSLVAYLATEAMGSENVFSYSLPYTTSSPESEEHACLVAERLKIHYESIPITPMIDAYFAQFPDADISRRGNKMARERMTILYDHSARLSGLVLGTSNKSELLLGYATLHGDMASALHPIGDLYKTQVRLLAKEMQVPQVIIDKKPTPDFWRGQTDEEDLGFTYEEVDKLLYRMVDLRFSRDELIQEGFAAPFVDKIYDRIKNTHFKRRLPVIAKVSNRTLDRDFKYSRDWGR